VNAHLVHHVKSAATAKWAEMDGFPTNRPRGLGHRTRSSSEPSSKFVVYCFRVRVIRQMPVVRHDSSRVHFLSTFVRPGP
jgi:hypothetical protein